MDGSDCHLTRKRNGENRDYHQLSQAEIGGDKRIYQKSLDALGRNVWFVPLVRRNGYAGLFYLMWLD